MRASGPARALLAGALLGILSGCVGPDPAAYQLDLSDGEGDFLVVLELVDGKLERAEATWAADAAPPEHLLDATVARWDVLVLKDDVGVDHADVIGTPEHAFVVWRSSDVGARVDAGDVFTFFVVDREGGDKIAEFRVRVTA